MTLALMNRAIIFIILALPLISFAENPQLTGSFNILWTIKNRHESFVLITDQKDPNVGRFQKINCSYEVESDWSGTGILLGYPKKKITNRVLKCLDATFVKLETLKNNPGHLYLNRSSDVTNHNQGGVQIDGTVDYSAEIIGDGSVKDTKDVKHYVFSIDGLTEVKTSMRASIQSVMTKGIQPTIAGKFDGLVTLQNPVLNDGALFEGQVPKIQLSHSGSQLEISYPDYQYPMQLDAKVDVPAAMMNANQPVSK